MNSCDLIPSECLGEFSRRRCDIGLSLSHSLSAQVTSSTALASSIATLLCGLFANLPFAIAPGMGLNAYLTFSLVLGIGMPVEQVPTQGYRG